jgi:hypothetical protein
MLWQLMTYLIFGGTLLLLFNVVFSGAYLGRAPHGDGAMIVVVPMLGTILAGVLLSIAAVISGMTSGTLALGAVHSGRWVCVMLSLGVTVGIAIGCFSVFAAWVNGGKGGGKLEVLTLATQWLSGAAAPVVLGLALLVASKVSLEFLGAHAGWMRAVKVLFASAGVMGILGYLHVAGDVMGAVAQHRKYAGVGMISQLMPDEYVRQRHAGKVTNQIATELPKLGPDAPLWNVAALLVVCLGEDAQSVQDRQAVLSRGIQCDDLDTQMLQVLTHGQPLLRRGGFQFIAGVTTKALEKHAAMWATGLQVAIESAADEMRGRPDWATEAERNVDTAGYVADLLAAGQRFVGTPQYAGLQRSLQQLADAAGRLKPSKEKDEILKRFEMAPGR